MDKTLSLSSTRTIQAPKSSISSPVGSVSLYFPSQFPQCRQVNETTGGPAKTNKQKKQKTKKQKNKQELESLHFKGAYIHTYIQLSLNGSNVFGNMESCSRQGWSEPLRVVKEPGQEANAYNLGMYFRSSIKSYVQCTH